MQHNYILPFIFSNDYLYKYGVADIKLVDSANDVYVFIKYNRDNIKNRKLFLYLLNNEKFLYNYYYEDLFTVKLKLDNFTSWYVKTMYHGGEDFISFHDLLERFKKEIPAARESSRDLFFNRRLISLWIFPYIVSFYMGQ
jgi:hypothetical protein